MALSVLGTIACNNEPTSNHTAHNGADSAHNGHMKTPHAQQAGEMQRIMDNMMADMHSVSSSGNPDRDFAAMMISHHQGAIEMARAELTSGKDAEIRKLADGIITAQEAQIAQMQTIMAGLPKGNANADGAAYDALMGSMGGMMHSNTPSSGNMDKDFLQAMIPHHEGAVEMAKVEIRYGRDGKLKALAQKIIDDQTREIAQMQAWLSAPDTATP